MLVHIVIQQSKKKIHDLGDKKFISFKNQYYWCYLFILIEGTIHARKKLNVSFKNTAIAA